MTAEERIAEEERRREEELRKQLREQSDKQRVWENVSGITEKKKEAAAQAKIEAERAEVYNAWKTHNDAFLEYGNIYNDTFFEKDGKAKTGYIDSNLILNNGKKANLQAFKVVAAANKLDDVYKKYGNLLTPEEQKSMEEYKKVTQDALKNMYPSYESSFGHYDFFANEEKFKKEFSDYDHGDDPYDPQKAYEWYHGKTAATKKRSELQNDLVELRDHWGEVRKQPIASEWTKLGDDPSYARARIDHAFGLAEADLQKQINDINKVWFPDEYRTWFDPSAFDGNIFSDLAAIGATLYDAAESAVGGVLDIGEGALDTALYGVEALAMLFAGPEARHDVENLIKKDLYSGKEVVQSLLGDVSDYSLLGKKSEDLIASMSQMFVTGKLQSTVGVPWWVTTGTTAFGEEVESAFNQGASYFGAGASGIISAGSEILSEQLFGGIKFGKGTLDDITITPLLDKISNKALRTAAKFGVDVAGEGFEEVFSSIMSRLGSSLYREENLADILWSEEALDEYIESFISGAVMGGGSSLVKGGINMLADISDTKSIGKDILGREGGFDALIDVSKNTPELSKYVDKANKKASPYNVGKLYKEARKSIPSLNLSGKVASAEAADRINDAFTKEIDSTNLSEEVKAHIAMEFRLPDNIDANSYEAEMYARDFARDAVQAYEAGQMMQRKKQNLPDGWLEENSTAATSEQLDYFVKLGRESVLAEAVEGNKTITDKPAPVADTRAYTPDTPERIETRNKFLARSAEEVRKATKEDTTLNEKQREAAEYGEKLGIAVGFEDLSKYYATQRDGLSQKNKGVVIIDKFASNPMEQVLIHEFSHVAETAKSYAKLKKTIMGSKLLDRWLTEKGFTGDGLDGRIESYKKAKIDHYKENKETLDDNGAEAEMIANFLGETIGTEAKMDKFLSELTTEQKRTFIEWLKDIWNKIFGKNKAPKELRHIEKLFGKALTEAGENARTETKNSEQFNISKNDDYSDYDKPITVADVQKLRAIGRKSINKFTDSDIKASAKWAYKFYQELGTKSPFFRAWFGDWRAFDHTLVEVATIPEYIATNEARKKSRGKVVNKDTSTNKEKTNGWIIDISREGETNTISHSGKTRLSEYGLSGIKELIEKGILLGSEIHEHHSNNAINDYIAFDHKLYSLGKNTSGEIALYKITIEERYQDHKHTNERRFHNLKYIEKIATVGGRTADLNLLGVSTNDSIAIEYSISDLFNFVKTYDSEFKPHPVNEVLLNDDGTPKVFYHGSGTRFTTFDVNEIAPWEGSLFVAENREDAAAYGKFVMPLYVTGKKLADYDNQPSEFYRLKDKNAQAKWLKERDYDGWYADMDSGGWGEVSVFTPEQIKSAENNIGTFNKYDADTQFSIADTKYTEKQYNTFGWATYNGYITAGEREQAFSNFADYKKRGFKFKETEKGEVIFPVGDKETTIVFIDKKSNMTYPNITRVLKVTDSWSDIIDILKEEFKYDKSESTKLLETSIHYFVECGIYIENSKRSVPAYSDYSREFARRNSKELDYVGTEQQDGGRSDRSGEEADRTSESGAVIEEVQHSIPEKSSDGQKLTDGSDDVEHLIPENGIASTIERDNRTALATALEGIVTNTAEREIVVNYKNNIAVLNKYEADLKKLKAERKKLSFAKGPRNTARLAELDGEIKKLSGRITRLDKKLVDLEAASPIKSLIEREKGRAKKSTAKKYQKARKEAVEKRQKTELRVHIAKKFNELNTWLLKPTKEKHISESLRVPVVKVLEIVNLGKAERYEKAIERLENQMATAEDYDALYYYLGKQSAKKEKLESLKHALQDMRDAYTKIGNQEGENPYFFDKNVADAIEDLLTGENEIGNTPLHELNKAQLQQLDKAISMLHKTVTEANKMFNDNIKRTRAEVGNVIENQLRETNRPLAIKLMQRAISYMLKPDIFFKNIGSKMLNLLWKNIKRAESQKALLVQKAKNKAEEIAKKYNAKKWDMKSRKEFVSANNVRFTLSLGEMMTLYAYSKREQAKQHITVGGFEYSEQALKNYRKAYSKHNPGKAFSAMFKTDEVKVLSEEMLEEISTTLTEEQRNFVDDLVAYLSNDMAKLGNEVTMKRYDIKGFTEGYYFPIVSSQNFLYYSPDKTADPNILNMGFTKELNPNATNTLVLYDFMELWGKHVDNMTTYATFALPMEDLTKAFNYGNVKKELEKWDGKGKAVEYIKQLMKDINHATRGDPSARWVGKRLADFKFAQTGLSLSTIIQQPSSLPRAFAKIEPRYFFKPSKKVDEAELEKISQRMLKHSGLAILKEMGSYDTDLGKSTADYVSGKSTFLESTKETIGKAPAYMDKIVWMWIWKAAENKVTAETNLAYNTDQYWERVREVFEECVSETQVYDSTLSRSQIMRSKDTGAKMVTAFMSEPTTIVNMVYDALVDISEGNVKSGTKTMAYVTMACMLNAILVSLVYAERDENEELSYQEKFIEALIGETMEAVNLLTYFPIIKDVWSVTLGYSVDRTDMSVIAKLYDSAERLVKSDGSAEGWIEFTARLGNFFLPTYNAYREVKAAVNMFNQPDWEVTEFGTKAAIRNALRKGTPFLKWTDNPSTKKDALYDSLIAGDMAYHNRLKKTYSSEEAYRKALISGFKENDSRIVDAALADLEMDVGKRVSIAKEIQSEGLFSQKEIVDAIFSKSSSIKKEVQDALALREEGDAEGYNKAVNELKLNYSDADVDKLLETIETPEIGDSVVVDSYYKVRDFNYALESADSKVIAETKSSLIDYYQDKGMTHEEAESALKRSVTSYWKQRYIEAALNKDSSEMQRIQKVLENSGLYRSTKQTVREWVEDYRAEQRKRK